MGGLFSSCREPKNPNVSRTNIGILGLDIVTIKNEAAIRQAEDCGDLVRVNQACPKMSDVPWFVRQFFSISRFFYQPSGWFLPLRGAEQDPSYAPCRSFLDTKFALDHKTNIYAAQVADILLNQPENKESDQALKGAFINALATRFTPNNQEIPPDIIQQASKQVGDVTEALNPLNRGPSKRAIANVCTHFQKALQETGDYDKLPKQCVIDTAHICFAIDQNAVPVLRELAKDPSLNIETLTARVGPVKDVPRMTVTDSTIGGLLPDNKPAVAGKTVVLLNIRSAAQSTDKASFAFGTGTDHRACAAKPAILSFLRQVQVLLQEQHPGGSGK